MNENEYYSARATSSDNADATATISAVTGANGQVNKLEGVMATWSYSGTPTGGKVTIKRGTTTIDEVDVTASGPGYLPLNGLETAYNEALAATIAAGGSGIIGKVCIRAKRSG